MTTIVYRDGVMAADRLITSNGIRRGHSKKIFKAANGALIGVSGSAGLADRFVSWIGDGGREEERPRIPEGSDLFAIVAYPEGEVAVFSERLVPQVIEAPFAATGSGNEIALGAMAMGASAERAVAVAIEFDAYSGGTIDTVAFDAP